MSGFVTINKQRIPWSFIMMVRKALGGDYDRTVDLFWRARNCPPPGGVFGFVKACLKRDKDGMLSIAPSPERENGKMAEVWRWWHGLKEKPRHKAPSSVADIFADLAKGASTSGK